MVTFRCPNCGQKLKALETQGGWIKTCPRCRRKIDIPEPTESGSPAPPPYSQMLERVHEESPTPDPVTQEPITKSRFAQVTKVLLYPCSASGLLNVLLTAALLLCTRHRYDVSRVLGPRVFVLGLLIGFLVYWYLVECVDSSIQGRKRAPDYAHDMWDPDEVSARLVHLTMLFLVCLLPSCVYYIATGTIDRWLGICIVWAATTAPMALLGVLTLDSLRAFDPLFLFRSISRVLPRYLLLVALMAASMFLGILMYLDAGYHPAPFRWLDTLPAVAMSYWTVILAHLLGRFYPDNEETLDWDV